MTYDTDEDAVVAEVEAASREGRIIDDGAARTIASWYHAPNNPPQMLDFVATGRIAPAPASWLPAPSGTTWLDALHRYAGLRPNRGAVAGWSHLWVPGRSAAPQPSDARQAAQTSRQHYDEARRLLDVAMDARTEDGVSQVLATAALTHAVLALFTRSWT